MSSLLLDPKLINYLRPRLTLPTPFVGPPTEAGQTRLTGWGR